MNTKTTLALLGALFVVCFSGRAYALDQLPLPKLHLAPVAVQIVEFTNADTRSACQNFLKSNSRSTEERIRAIKAYRQCQADHALQQLAVWRWQDTESLN